MVRTRPRAGQLNPADGDYQIRLLLTARNASDTLVFNGSGASFTVSTEGEAIVFQGLDDDNEAIVIPEGTPLMVVDPLNPDVLLFPTLGD